MTDLVFSKLKPSKNMVTVEGDLTNCELIMLSSLQGIVAQSKAQIVIKCEDCYQSYVDYLKQNGYNETAYTDAWQVVELFKPHINRNGYVCFDPADINLAATVSGAEGWLMVPREIEGQAIARGLVKKFDFNDFSFLTHIQKKDRIFEVFKDKLSRGGIVHQSPDKWYLRDLAIALKLFCFYTNESDALDIEFRRKVFAWADTNIPVMGWSDDEIAFIKDCSEYGKFVLPMDWSQNHSYFAGIRVTKKLVQKARPQPIKAQKGKHYLAIVVSDGDNIQWLVRNFATASTFGQRLAKNARKDYKISWTFPPLLNCLGGAVADYIYDIATQNDSFVSGVSGAGYINCTNYPDSHLKDFTELTSRAIKQCDIDVVTLLDNKQHFNSTDLDFIEKKLAYYSRFSNIKGGIWEMDPDAYEAGKGEIYFSNGKPFVSIRLSFWHRSNDPANVDNAWIDSYSERINSFAADPTSKEGYTVLNMHPWTTSIADLERLISRLKPHVEIVSASEIIDLITKNIRRTT